MFGHPFAAYAHCADVEATWIKDIASGEFTVPPDTLAQVTAIVAEGRRVRDALAVDFTGMILRDQMLRHQAREKFPRLDIAGSMAAYGYLMADRVMARGCEGPTDE